MYVAKAVKKYKPRVFKVRLSLGSSYLPALIHNVVHTNFQCVHIMDFDNVLIGLFKLQESTVDKLNEYNHCKVKSLFYDFNSFMRRDQYAI